MLKQVCQVLENIEQTSSNKEKLNILKTYSKDVVLEFLLDTALNPFYTYGVKKFDDKQVHINLTPHVTEVRDLRDRLSRRQCTGNNAIEECRRILLCEDDLVRKWLVRVFKKNLRAGITAKTVNKVFTNLIPTFDIGLCEQLKKEELPAGDWIIEPKLDGLRCLAFIDKSGDTIFLSRGNKELYNTQFIQKEIKRFGMGNVILDGELMAVNWNDTCSILHTEKVHPKMKELKFYVFDILNGDEWETKKSKTLFVRKTREDIYFGKSEIIIAVPYTLVSSYDEAEAKYKEYLDSGFEGVVLKEYNSVYPFKRSKNWLKWKPMNTVEVIITGYEEGTGKNKGRLGAFVCDYKGKKVKVGSGYTDEQREKFWAERESVNGKIIEVQIQTITKTGSLRFPVFIRLRDDL